MKKSTKLSAFTLIELLIVIAVIGILAGMLFPAIKAVMNSAQGTRVANNGKQIVTAITTANIDREANSKGDIWPTKGKWEAEGGANKYFARLLGAGNTKVELTGINTTMFAGGGVEAAKDADALESGGNIWSMLAGISVCDDNMPFIWTRNMKDITTDDFNISQENQDSKDFAEYLDDGETPFGSAQVVLARKGASFQVIKAKDLTAATFLASSTNGNVEVVKAVAGASEQVDSDF